MKKLKEGKWFKFLLFTFFVIFMALYVSQMTGYYEYSEQRKTILTDEAIKEFEQDVKDGKDVDIKKYVDTNANNYDNNATNFANSISDNIQKYSKKTIDSLFSFINKVVSE